MMRSRRSFQLRICATCVWVLVSNPHTWRSSSSAGCCHLPGLCQAAVERGATESTATPPAVAGARLQFDGVGTNAARRR